MIKYNKFELIKILRSITNISILECKKALEKHNFNLEQSIKYLVSLNKLHSINDKSYDLKEGIIMSKSNNKLGVMLEVNCCTDFVVKNQLFINFCQTVLDTALIKQISLENLQKLNKDIQIKLEQQIKEKILIRKLIYLDENFIYSYVHNNKIGVLISIINKDNLTSINNVDANILKQICMHIISKQPLYIKKNDISRYFLEKKYQNEKKLALSLGKNILLSQKIAHGKVKKMINEICLYKQSFILNENITIKDFMFKNNILIHKFILLKLGY